MGDPYVVEVPVAKLMGYSPFGNEVWVEVCQGPITWLEVRRAVVEGQLARWRDLGDEKTRDYHIRRMAYLAVHGWDDGIELDVGIPCLNYWNP